MGVIIMITRDGGGGEGDGEGGMGEGEGWRGGEEVKYIDT